MTTQEVFNQDRRAPSRQPAKPVVESTKLVGDERNWVRAIARTLNRMIDGGSGNIWCARMTVSKVIQKKEQNAEN